jgi:uncharacterized SAM-binding protein YcdF (DUF218 family)
MKHATLLTIPLLFLLAWTAGLLWFVHIIPDSAPVEITPTDAIVVLTGGSNRLITGIKLLEAQKAKKLLITGVGENATITDLTSLSKEVDRTQVKPLENRIIVGHIATDTISNAVETAIWMEFEQYHSLRLVTANYHIPRAVLQFQAMMPDITIIPHPVFPANFKLHQWWVSPGTAKLVISEYHKYFALKCLLLSGIHYKG